MSDIRQEFEAKFKMPEGVKYGSHDGTRTYFAESREHRREADTYRHLWLGYQAAHKAQQAEIERLKKRNNELFYTLKWLFEMTDDLDCEDYSRVDRALEGNQ